jgi:GxxExxY protein
MADNYKHSEITVLIIKAFYNVYNQRSYGFLERVYENAMMIELKKSGLESIAQFSINVFYDDIKVGFYIADIIVNSCVIIEVKAAESLCEEHEAQLTNYLRATDIEVGTLLNFGKIQYSKGKFFLQNTKIFTNLNHHNNPRSNK